MLDRAGLYGRVLPGALCELKLNLIQCLTKHGITKLVDVVAGCSGMLGFIADENVPHPVREKVTEVL
ncbi:MAG TPA: hypothetical protein PLP17_14250 [Oligoflexia bacterium]|nr:hypothetical protein [Oligoflexia bacterium]